MHTVFSWRQAVRAFFYTTLIRALVFPVSASAMSPVRGPLMAPLSERADLSVTGRALPDTPNGVTLATVRGTALVNPATPVTVRGHRFAHRSAVRPGTTFRILATAYSSTPDQTDGTPFITASGTHVHDGTVAINFLPFGTKVRFLDYRPGKVFAVEDRHHPRLSDRADLWFPTRAAALQFGARILRMEIVE